MRLTEYIAGYYICESEKHSVRVVNYMNRRGVKYYGLHDKNGVTVFRIIKNNAKKHPEILKLCEKTAEKSLIKSIKSKLKRPGLVIGFVICIFTLIFSGMFVWDVSLSTGGSEDAERIMKVLEENGLRRGALKTSLDRKRLENIVMLSCPDVSYIAINQTGNNISVKTDERVIKDALGNNGPCDLTAGEDGYIIRYEMYKGQAVCEAGTAVKRGDVLITGVVETKHHGTELVHSSGKVFALVKRSYLVKTSAEYDEKVYTGNEFKTVTLRVFSFNFTVRDDERKENCDIFESTNRVSAAGSVDLPVFIRTTLYREYTTVRNKRTEEQIREELERLSSEQFSKITEGCEVRASNETVYQKDGIYYLYCDVWCATDIAVETPIYEKTEEIRK